MKLENEDLIKLYTNMVLARKLDEIVIRSMQEGKVVSFYHSGQGSEALGVGVSTFLRPDDFLWPHHRGHGIAYLVGKGSPLGDFLAEHYGKASGSCNGISGFHYADPETGVLGCAGTIGSAFPIALGWGLACKKNGKQQIAVACFGDGGSNRGTLHEAFNLASIWKLPIVWVCDNNGYAQWMPIKDAFPRDDIADLAAGYDMPGVVVDGMDVLAVHEAIQAAVDRARAGEGPSMIEAKTARYRPHGEGLPDVVHFEPRPAEEIEAWKKRDPIITFGRKLVEQDILPDSDLERLDQEISDQAEAMDKKATEDGPPDASILVESLYAD
jgi:pyruvate dehydrogenase E1 component alpha subunit